MDTTSESNTIVNYKIGEQEVRPWGRWEVVDVGLGHITKRVVIEPGQLLSYHVHAGRNEHWIIVSGTAVYKIDDTCGRLLPGQAVFIPSGTPHSIGNEGSEPVVQVEIQTGELLDESDIVRMEDRYGRA